MHVYESISKIERLLAGSSDTLMRYNGLLLVLVMGGLFKRPDS